MAILSSKKEALFVANRIIIAFQTEGLEAAVDETHQLYLTKKVKFPVLEAVAHYLSAHLPIELHIAFCKRIMALHTIGGNVMVGILLQKQLADDRHSTLTTAADWIIQQEVWYSCDIIGERVWGEALVRTPQQMLVFLKAIPLTANPWIIRLIGITGHYGVKRGLDKANCEILFQVLLLHQHHKAVIIKKTIAWAAKTIKRYHPEIPGHYQKQWGKANGGSVWFASALK